MVRDKSVVSRASLPVAKLVEDGRASGESGWQLATLIDAALVEVAQKLAGGFEVGKLRRVEAKDSSARGISRDQVAAHRENAEAARRAHDGTIAFHADNSIDDRQARPTVATRSTIEP